jgi:Matrixin
MKKRSRRFTVERLEDRCTPTTWGTPWPDAEHLTLSFAPDGTAFPDQQSQLFQALAPLGTAAWQTEILRAFQTWAVNANINVSVVSDGGQPFGTSGPFQGDPRFGDVRIGARTLNVCQLGRSNPFDWTGGTWTGDISLNTAYQFGLNHPSSGYDLFSVMLHEAGHAFGLDHSNVQGSAMYEIYQYLTALSSGDVNAIQALYGARTPDWYEGPNGNNSFSTASSIVLYDGKGASPRKVIDGDITTSGDKDYFKITPITDPGPLAVRLWTSGISSLKGRLTVYDSSGAVIGSAVAPDPMHGDLSVHLDGLTPNRTYYFKVDNTGSDVFGIGSYRMILLPDSVALAGPPPSSTYTVTNGWISYDNHTNDTITKATSLQQHIAKTDSRFDSSYEASLHDATDVDYYSLTAPSGVGSQPEVMTAVVWAMQPGQFDPQITIYDAAYHVVPARVITHDGAYVVQMPNAVPGAYYYLKVQAGPAAAGLTGNYLLGVDFGTTAVDLQTAASGTLTDAQRQASSTLNVTKNTLFHFVLRADTANPSVESAVRMTIFDQYGNAVFTTVALAGQTVSANVYLTAGTYRVVYAAGTRSGAPLPALTFNLSFLEQGDGLDPYTINSTSTTTTTTTTSSSYYWGSLYYATWLALTNPYSQPYWY